MEKDSPTGPDFGEIPEARKIASHIIQPGSPGEFLSRRFGELKNQRLEEGSLSLAQWEAQWQQFLWTLEKPQSGWGMPPLPEKPSPWEDAKAFLASFEQVAKACQWPREEWATRLLPALSGEAKWAFDCLGDPDREDYGKVKAAILRGEALCQEKRRQEFRGFGYQEAEGPRGAYRRLWEMCRGWLKLENHSKEQILEFLVLEQLLNVLPSEIQNRVRESGPGSCSQAVVMAEELLLRQGKQVHLEEAAGRISETGQDPSESGWRDLLMDIKEEEDREAIPLAGSTDEKAGELQRSSLEIAVEEKENESLSAVNTFIQKKSIVPQEQIWSGEKPYNCLECGKSFSRRTALASHQRIHSGDDEGNDEDKELHGLTSDKVENQKLKGNFRNPGGPKRQRGNHPFQETDPPYPCHEGDFREIIHTGEEVHKYLECGVDISDQAQYNTHLPNNNGKNTSKCLECGKSFSCRSELLRHHKIHTAQKAYICSPNDKSSSHKARSLIQYQRIHSEGKPPVIYSGSENSFSDETKDNVYFPKYSTMNACKCFQCGKYFRCKSQLLVHQRTHAKKKPFECSECGKKFTHNSYLQRHRKIHTGEKLFECSECGNKFRKNYHLQMHLRTHTGEKPFECSECGKKFSQNYNLQRHQIIHTGEKPFECTECEKRFSENCSLQQHQRIHRGEKPFECSECGKRFGYRGAHQRHQKIHTGEKPFECSNCGKRFSENFSLQRHLQIHSGEKLLSAQCVKRNSAKTPIFKSIQECTRGETTKLLGL